MKAPCHQECFISVSALANTSRYRVAVGLRPSHYSGDTPTSEAVSAPRIILISSDAYLCINSKRLKKA